MKRVILLFALFFFCASPRVVSSEVSLAGLENIGGGNCGVKDGPCDPNQYP